MPRSYPTQTLTVVAMQGDIVLLDVNSRQQGQQVVTADDCCNACRQNRHVSLPFHEAPCTAAF